MAWGDINNDGRPDFIMNSSVNSNATKAIEMFIQNTNVICGNDIGVSAPITATAASYAATADGDENGSYDFHK